PPHPRTTRFPYTTLFRSRRIRVPPRVDRVLVECGRERRRHRGGVLRGSAADGHPHLDRDEAAVGRQPLAREERAVVGGEEERRRSEEHTSELQSQSNLVC